MARPHPALIELAACRPLPPVTDHDEVTRSALEHRMQGLLFTAVMADGGWPEATIRSLAQRDLRTRSHHATLSRTLEEVVGRLHGAGVDVASAKGVTSEQRWYDRVGERPCNDIDLLIRPGTSMRDVVSALQPTHPLGATFTDLADGGVLQSVDLLVDGCEIDVHTDIFKIEVPTIGMDELWARTQIMAGSDLRVLDPETALIHLLLHTTKDRFSRLLSYADVARILRREELDWDHIGAFCRREGFELHVNAALHAITTALDLPRPPVPRPDGLGAVAHRLLWGPSSRLRGTEGFIAKQHRQLWMPMTMRGRLPEAVTWWLRRRIAPPKALMDLYFPDTSGPYLWRLLIGRGRRHRERRTHLRQVTVGSR